MANEGMLLRLLEPVIRPDGLPSSGTKTQAVPFDQRSFDSFLNEAEQLSTTGSTNESDAMKSDTAAANNLSGLSGLNNVENAAIRMMLDAGNKTNIDR